MSVCLSVTLLYCVKATQATVKKSSLWAAKKTLVLYDKILCCWVRGFFSNKGVKAGYPCKKPGHAGIKIVILRLLARLTVAV